jgi:predicted phosphodiesterase
MAFAVLALPANDSQSTQKFVTLADIHFDPFFACKELPQPCSILEELRTTDYQKWDTILTKSPVTMSSFMEDTNYYLLQTALLELKKINQNDKPQFVIILGDFLAHRFHEKYKKYSGDKSSQNYYQFVNKTLQFLTYQLNKTFPNISVYPVIGNNDTYTGNYNVVPNGLFLQDTANTWDPLIKDKKNQSNFLRLFPRGGYYSISLPDNQKILILNTVLFSSASKKNNMAIAAKNQLKWLQSELKIAAVNHSKVILAFHIPEDDDTLTSIKMYLLPIKKFWQPEYVSEFDNILKQYQHTITTILAAHTHINSSRVNHETTPISVIFTPSISPIYGNNPGFNVMTYDITSLYIEMYVTYFFSETSNLWDPEYTLSDTPLINNSEISNKNQVVNQLEKSI